MRMRVVAAVAVAAMLAVGPALAATTSASTSTPAASTTTAKPAATTAMTAKPKMGKIRYYIAEASDTKACSVVAAKPDGKTDTMVGKFWYSTDAKATAAMKHQAACKTKAS